MPNNSNKTSALADTISKETQRMSAALDALTAQVTATNTVIASALTLINGLAAEIAAAGTDETALAALTTSLTIADAQLATAVAANTPAAPAVAATPSAIASGTIG